MTVGSATAPTTLPATPAGGQSYEPSGTKEFQAGLPQGPGATALAMFEAGGRHAGMMVEDGVGETVDHAPLIVGGAVGTNAILAARQVMNEPGPSRSVGQLMGRGMKVFASNPMKVTPTLACAVAGPAIADAVSYAVPDILPKATSSNRSKQDTIAAGRGIVAGGVVGAAAAVAFLVKPSLFQKWPFAVHNLEGLGAGARIKQWAKDYATKIAPITAMPAGAAAWTYMDLFNDFGKITDTRSPFRK